MNRVGELWEIHGIVHVCLGEHPSDSRMYELAVQHGVDDLRGSLRPHGRSVFVYKAALDQPPPKNRKDNWWRRLA